MTFWSKSYCSHFDRVSFPTLVLRLHTHTTSRCWLDKASLCLLYLYFHFAFVSVFVFVLFPTLVLELHTHTESGCSVVDQLSLCQLRSVNLTIRLQDPAAICLCVCICICVCSCICIIVQCIAMSLSTPRRLPHSVNTKNVS